MAATYAFCISIALRITAIGLPDATPLAMLRGKSRALGQRVSLGDQRLAPEACSEALCGAVCLGAGHLQQHSYAVSTRHGCQLNGAHSPHASFHDVCYEAATTTCIVQMLLGLFMALQLQTSAAGSTSGKCCNASGSTHRDRTGGRGSTATQPTHRELAPQHAAGKVPCLGAESVIGRPKASA